MKVAMEAAIVKVRPITRLRLFLATLVLAVALELGLTTVLEVPKTEAGESRPDTPENLTAGADVFGAMTTSDPMRLAAVDKMINQRSGPWSFKLYVQMWPNMWQGKCGADKTKPDELLNITAVALFAWKLHARAGAIR